MEQKIALVVTVDCGAGEAERVDRLARAGVDVIVADHHEPGPRVPPAVAVINPKDAGGYPFRGLSGVGVAFKLAWALCESLAGSPRVGPRLRRLLLGLLPLVAVGTIADVAPLVSENRVLAATGLRGWPSGPPGLRTLAEMARVAGPEPSARQIAFGLAPRLNAAGRMESAEPALLLLLEDDPAVAGGLAAELDRLNAARQAVCRKVMEEAEPLAREALDQSGGVAAVVGREGWHEGVIGIVAGRLAEKTGRPAAVVAFAPGREEGKGSARAAGRVHLYRALEGCRGHLSGYGGHERAAGFRVPRRSLEGFARAFASECRRQAADGPAAATETDGELPLPEAKAELARELELLRPHGEGNPAPRFIARGVRVAGKPRLAGGGGKRFVFWATQSGAAVRAEASGPEWLAAIDAGTRAWDLVYRMRFDRRRRPPLDLEIDDMWPAAAP